jgi:flagellar basal-body rod modification protein FlgD
MTPLPISSIAALAPQATSSTSSTSSTTSSTSLDSENVFLQLLVAQLKNQDPEQPTDGTAFVTELAQFTTLQEDTESATDLDKIVASLPPTTTTTTTPASNTTPTAAANPTNAINQ